ncbi:YraN family protein [Aquimarina hainanensis]|uniref:UPF0102 protein ACFSTE_06750 n=1 Tax=Aquimarina hainanensis TaxID=1578017 RepID=A0ABW5N4G2_9FLAO
MAEHNQLGKKGEKLAVDFLVQKGYKILEENYRFQKSEIDIIAENEGLIIVVEVKTRSSEVYGAPHEFVKPKQIQSLVKVIDHYIVEKDIDMEVRFDIISIINKGGILDVTHLENAFYHF